PRRGAGDARAELHQEQLRQRHDGVDLSLPGRRHLEAAARDIRSQRAAAALRGRMGSQYLLEERRRPALIRRTQSFFAPDVRTIGPQRRISSATKALNSLASRRLGVMPSWRSLSRTSEVSSARRTSAFNLLTISAGRPAGPESENQTIATRSG